MSKAPIAKCPYCGQIEQFEDAGVAWTCPNCPGVAISEYTDEDGKVHNYRDPYDVEFQTSRQTNIWDMDGLLVPGSPEQGVFYNTVSLNSVIPKLLKLADTLDQKGFYKEADSLDRLVTAVKFDKASTQIDYLPKEAKQQLKDIQKTIDKDILGEYGIEKEHHVTLLYGLEATAKEVEEYLKEEGLNKPLKLKSRKKIEYFDNGKGPTEENEGSVAIIRIDSKGLKKLHNSLKSKFKNSHFKGEYKPHMTIAYLKLDERLNNKIESFEWEVDEIIYSSKNGKKTKIKLKGE